MRPATAILAATLTAAVVGALGGCSTPEASPGMSTAVPSGALSDTATVTYAFTDASVPPQYHRSFRLTVTRGTTSIVVDSYGDVLAEESVPTPPEVWAALDPAALESLTVTSTEEGCTGGTSTGLTVVDGSDTLVDLQAEECGGLNEVAVAAINGWIAPARMLLPSIDALAPSEE